MRNRETCELVDIARLTQESSERSEAVVTKYDYVKWHRDGDFPIGLESRNGATHIGFFLAWIIDHRLESSSLTISDGDLVGKVRTREVTGVCTTGNMGNTLDREHR